MGNTFLSYSRHQYYFAESLALQLQQQGQSVWFDIQQIEPGVNWKVDIDAGLTDCTSLTLVASRSALASPYVSAEWKYALENNKPIYVALYERVRLPAELLQRAVIVDCRSDFDQGVQSLIAQFQNPDRSHPPNMGRLRLPEGVARMARLLALRDLRRLMSIPLILAIYILLSSEGSIARWLIDNYVGPGTVTTLAPLYVALVGIFAILNYAADPLTIFQTLRFLKHNFDYQALVQLSLRAKPTRIPLVFPWIILAASYVYLSTDLIVPSASRQPPIHSAFTWEGLLLLLGAIALTHWIGVLSRRVKLQHPHPDIVRWATLGAVSQEWRQQVNQGIGNPELLPFEKPIQQTMLESVRRLQDKPINGAARTYQIVSTPADHRTAHQVKVILELLGYQKVDGKTACTVLILSYRTPLTLIHECLQDHAQIISVMASDFNLPNDLAELSKFQLVDYRNRDFRQLHAALGFLTDDTEEGRATLSQNMLPVNLAQTGKTPGLRALFSIMLALAGFSLLYVFYFLARLAVFGIPFRTLPAALELETVGIAILIIVNLLFIWFGIGALRGVSRVPLRLIFLGGAAIPIIIALIERANTLPPEIALTLPVAGFRVVHLGILQALIWVSVYGVIYLSLVWTLFTHPHLLNPPHAPVLGVRAKPNWRGVTTWLLAIVTFIYMGILGKP